jgi:cysteine desulfurase / selenocysteine lyase
VNQAWFDYQERIGAAAGRGLYASSQSATQLIHRTRESVAKLIGAKNPKSVAFTSSGTASLNLAIHGLLRPNDHVVTTTIEHNSALRPLAFLKDRLPIEIDYAPCDPSGWVDPKDIQARLKTNTRLVIVSRLHSRYRPDIDPSASLQCDRCCRCSANGWVHRYRRSYKQDRCPRRTRT